MINHPINTSLNTACHACRARDTQQIIHGTFSKTPNFDTTQAVIVMKANSKFSVLKPGFHMIVTIATIAEKSAQQSQRSYGNTTGTIATIAAIAIAGIELGSISAIAATESDRKFLMAMTILQRSAAIPGCIPNYPILWFSWKKFSKYDCLYNTSGKDY